MYSAEQRTKEIGIRKVLGSTISNVIYLLVKDYIVIIIIGTMIALPLGSISIINWLESFAYRTEIGIINYTISFLIVALLAISTVGSIAYRAAIRNTIDVLKYE